MKAKIYITLKNGVLDPQGRSGRAGSLGDDAAEGARRIRPRPHDRKRRGAPARTHERLRGARADGRVPSVAHLRR